MVLFPEVTATSEKAEKLVLLLMKLKYSIRKIVVEVIVTLAETTRDVGETLSTAHTNEKVANHTITPSFINKLSY